MKISSTEDHKLKVFINIFVLAISLYGVSQRNYKVHHSSGFENMMIGFFGPMQKSVSFVHSSFTSVFDHYIANVGASKNNLVLKRKLLDLESEVFVLGELASENNRLKSLLAFGQQMSAKRILAQVIAKDASSDYKVIRINKGLSDGIELNAAVITGEGLVGYIYRLTDHFSDILTILDANNRIDGIVKRTRSQGVIEGDSNQLCIMKYVNRTEPVILNDIIITSGLGNIYPKGVRVGKVSRIEKESYGITQRIVLTPAVSFSKLEEVVILKTVKNVDKELEFEALDRQGEKK